MCKESQKVSTESCLELQVAPDWSPQEKPTMGVTHTKSTIRVHRPLGSADKRVTSSNYWHLLTREQQAGHERRPEVGELKVYLIVWAKRVVWGVAE
jgi:hypothetical protein